MNTSQIKVPICPLHVEIEGLARYRQAHGPALYVDAEVARAAFATAAHVAGMQVRPDDMPEMKLAG